MSGSTVHHDRNINAAGEAQISSHSGLNRIQHEAVARPNPKGLPLVSRAYFIAAFDASVHSASREHRNYIAIKLERTAGPSHLNRGRAVVISDQPITHA